MILHAAWRTPCVPAKRGSGGTGDGHWIPTTTTSKCQRRTTTTEVPAAVDSSRHKARRRVTAAIQWAVVATRSRAVTMYVERRLSDAEYEQCLAPATAGLWRWPARRLLRQLAASAGMYAYRQAHSSQVYIQRPQGGGGGGGAAQGCCACLSAMLACFCLQELCMGTLCTPKTNHAQLSCTKI